MKFDTHELAWAAGFFDGEGSTSYTSTRGLTRINYYPRLHISQKNETTLLRFQQAIGGFGKISAKLPRPGMYQWQLDRFEHVQAVIGLLWKYLSQQKKDQAIKVLTAYRTQKENPVRKCRKK